MDLPKKRTEKGGGKMAAKRLPESKKDDVYVPPKVIAYAEADIIAEAALSCTNPSSDQGYSCSDPNSDQG